MVNDITIQLYILMIMVISPRATRAIRVKSSRLELYES
ncbi:hypothetical protein PDE_05525 [Penicillium oxalicum 114-2]|uniref:Uncharacterized protein n=1 Tax=Penicillium oxalicum (strain 114-2 / CGMCC 5302) TaxID=933388 RepID=S8AWB9_PENO1|nr:hypothetical protein PDE_05525 [Penicillium oxalicum 114-2]